MTDPALEIWIVIFGLAVATFLIRIGGVFLGQRIPSTGGWARALNALPGCLIVALVSVLLLSGSVAEWIAGSIALCVALVTRNLPATMAAGIVSVFLLRHVLQG